MIFVADASAIGTFILEDEAGAFADYAQAVSMGNDVRVPPIFTAELSNLIIKAIRRGRIDEAGSIEALRVADLVFRNVRIEPDDGPSRIVERALAAGLSAYDTTYLMLAERLNVPLLAVDGGLRRAAVASGVTVLAP